MKGSNQHQDAFAQAWEEAFANAEQAPAAHVWEGVQISLAGDATAAAASAVFEDAEMPHSTDVWDKVDAALANDDAALYKQKMRRAQYLAAAAIALLLLIGGRSAYLNWAPTASPLQAVAIAPFMPANDWPALELTPALENNSRTTPDTQLASGSTDNTPTATANTYAADRMALATLRKSNKPVLDQPAVMAVATSSPEEVVRQGHTTDLLTATEVAFVATPVVATEEAQREAESNITVLKPITAEGTSVTLAPMEERPIYIMPQYVDRESIQPNSEPKAAFASLTMNGGYFSPNYKSAQSVGTTFTQSAGYVNQDAIEGVQTLGSKMQGGSTQSVGMSIGLPIAKKWILSLGAQLGIYNVQGHSNYTFRNGNEVLPTTPSTYDMISARFNYQNEARSLADYEVTEKYTFISVPIQAGYLAFQKGPISLWVQGGGVADIFTRNQISSEYDSFETYTITAWQADSPYQPVLVSGTVGTEVSYALSDHWSVSVNPTVKMSVNSLAREGEAFSGNPAFFDMGIRLKYQVQ